MELNKNRLYYGLYNQTPSPDTGQPNGEDSWVERKGQETCGRDLNRGVFHDVSPRGRAIMHDPERSGRRFQH
jgi:hypothetical protein